jgi:hypothetical protein
VTFVLVSVTWVFFRAQSFAQAFQLLEQLVQPSWSYSLTTRAQVARIVVLTVLMLAGQWMLRNASLEEAVTRLRWGTRSLVLALLIACLALSPGDDRAFIYFQF